MVAQQSYKTRIHSASQIEKPYIQAKDSSCRIRVAKKPRRWICFCLNYSLLCAPQWNDIIVLPEKGSSPKNNYSCMSTLLLSAAYCASSFALRHIASDKETFEERYRIVCHLQRNCFELLLRSSIILQIRPPPLPSPPPPPVQFLMPEKTMNEIELQQPGPGLPYVH
jgi:hypothetical protein